MAAIPVVVDAHHDSCLSVFTSGMSAFVTPLKIDLPNHSMVYFVIKLQLCVFKPKTGQHFVTAVIIQEYLLTLL